MGNCVPSRSDLPSMVETPREINRSSLSSILTRDTWTAGDTEEFTDNWCTMDHDGNESRSASVVSLPSSSPLFLLDTENVEVSTVPTTSTQTKEKSSNRFIPNQNDRLTDFQSDPLAHLSHHSEADRKKFPPKPCSGTAGLMNLNCDLHRKRHFIAPIPREQINKNQSYHPEGSPGDSGLGVSFPTSPRVVPNNNGLRNLSTVEQRLLGYCRTENYLTTETTNFSASDQKTRRIVDRETSDALPPIPPKSSYQDTVDRQRKRTNTPNLDQAGSAKLGAEATGVYQRPLTGTPEPMVVFATQAFIKTNESELSMVENERFLVLEYNPAYLYPETTPEDKRWLVARIDPRFHCLKGTCNRQGLVPARLLAPFKVTPNQHPAWFTVDRDEADRMLRNTNPCGTYMLRPSSDPTNAFALSLRFFDLSTRDWFVKHYRVRHKTNEDVFFVFRRAAFNTVEELINHHSVHSDGLVCTLHKPYPRMCTPVSSLNQLEVNRSSFVFDKLLGRGSFGEVWRATWDGRLSVAVKRLIANENVESERLLEEAKLMQRLNHPRIVQLLAVCTTPIDQPPYLVTELMENGSLKNYLRSLRFDQLQFVQLIQMMIWISEGMVYLERQNFIHRDLRASNVLVDDKYQLKVADFGLSHMLEEADEYIGTTRNAQPIFLFYLTK
ncbi:Tyrosine-protein kinase [Fasciola hepatica]|uniref:Tyrosine-protein kinase n=1 Tax=Fasciola hepatica TaxID=6192 RepID=A0A4E0S2S0_FASHE|nr:Tyrosine-protein kinase [Fasciola hepatica]